MDQILNILFGAVIASVVPVITLVLDQQRWKKEKKIELLRLKHDRLESMYSDILSRLSNVLSENMWPSDITSKVSVYGSEGVRNTYIDFIRTKDKDETMKKNFYLDMCLACHKHMVEVQKQIDSEL